MMSITGFRYYKFSSGLCLPLPTSKTCEFRRFSNGQKPWVVATLCEVATLCVYYIHSVEVLMVLCQSTTIITHCVMTNLETDFIAK